MELARDFKTLNVFATFKKVLRKIADLRAVTLIFNVGSWKTRKNVAKDFFYNYEKTRKLCY